MQRDSYLLPLPESSAANGQPPCGRPPVSLLRPALRDWHYLFAFLVIEHRLVRAVAWRHVRRLDPYRPEAELRCLLSEELDLL